jgi:hypothetical protein
MRCITRIDQASTRTHGFFVRVGWRYRTDGSYGPKHTAFFGDASHGGKRKALLAAQDWRDDVLAPKPRRAAPARRRSKATTRTRVKRAKR